MFDHQDSSVPALPVDPLDMAREQIVLLDITYLRTLSSAFLLLYRPNTPSFCHVQ